MTSHDFRSAIELSGLLAAGDISPLEIMEAALRRIEAVNSKINAFVSLRSEQALEEAKALTERMAAGSPMGPLAGIPIGVKDMEDAAGMVTSYGSIPFQDNTADLDSVQVSRLKAAGAIVVGKTNTPEFGFTGFTKNRLHGVTRNPWNPERTPGGSSGGSAAAVAGGMVPLCTGSDAGGSVRIPASYSGCFGLKPSYGRIPLDPFPVGGMGRLTVMGPITRTVSDAALYLDCTVGYHPSDPLSLPLPGFSYLECVDRIPGGMRIAYSPDLGYGRVQKEVAEQCEQASTVFAEMGHQVEKWNGVLPDTGDTWNGLLCMDLYAELEDILAEHGEAINRTMVFSLDATRQLTVQDLARMQRERRRLNDRLAALFGRYDLLLTPTMPTEAFAAGGPPPSVIEGEAVPPLGSAAFTYPFNISGHPAASVPAGFSKSGMPVGLQIVAPHHREDLLLQAARAFEQAQPWDRRQPDI